MIRDVLSAAVGIVLVLAMAVVQAQAPTTMNYQGRLLLKADQQAVDGNVVIVFSIWTGQDDMAATELWSETWDTVPVSNGIFSVMLGSNGTPLDPVAFYENSSVYLQLQIGSETLSPRQQLGSVAFAMGNQTRVSGSCGPGTYLSGIEEDGAVQCEPLNWQTFKDCSQCPLMINIPRGTVPGFAMGVVFIGF